MYSTQQFTFDRVYDQDTTQSTIYKARRRGAQRAAGSRPSGAPSRAERAEH